MAILEYWDQAQKLNRLIVIGVRVHKQAKLSRGRGRRSQPIDLGLAFFMMQQEALPILDVITGNLNIFGNDTFILIDIGAVHSFVF